MTPRDQLVEQALALPAEDRLYLADALESSLSSGGFATPEIAEAWAAELDQRISAYQRGAATALPMDESLERIRRRIAQPSNPSRAACPPTMRSQSRSS